jgi:phosphate starvation-inducible PhoH-like protein
VPRHNVKVAKRANRPNPRTERNLHILPNPESERLQRVQLIPRSLAQETYVEALTNPEKYIVIAVGVAGTGKTVLATEYAIRAYQEGRYKKIVITRPAVSVDEQLGYLPGDLIAKMQPWMRPILDVFTTYYSPKAVQHMLANEVVEIAPLAFCRGRTFRDAVVIADEMQNSTIAQTKMVLTRIGENSRIIMTGDLKQHDRGYEANGMRDFIERLKQDPNDGIAIVEFGSHDVERHRIIEHILRLYGEE